MAALARYRAPDDPELLAARRDFCAAEAADHMQEIVAKSPRFTEQQIGRIMLILARGNEARAG
jgi:hypothetical protein